MESELKSELFVFKSNEAVTSVFAALVPMAVVRVADMLASSPDAVAISLRVSSVAGAALTRAVILASDST